MNCEPGPPAPLFGHFSARQAPKSPHPHHQKGNRHGKPHQLRKRDGKNAGRPGRPRRAPPAAAARLLRPCSSATLERLAGHFELTILYYNPNIYPPEEYRRREAELERFVQDAGYAGVPVVELPYDPRNFTARSKGWRRSRSGAAAAPSATGFGWNGRRSMRRPTGLRGSPPRCPSRR